MYTAILLTLMIPFAALMIPLFIIMGKGGIINTHLAIILPTVASAFIIFYFRPVLEGVPVGTARRGEDGRFEGVADLPLDLRAGDAFDLRGGVHHRVHGGMETITSGR